jgi:hypothetical protein
MLLAELRDVLRALATARPVFHSEADFQHALAWEFHCQHPNAQIRLERQILPGLHLDLAVALGGRMTAFEVKYKTNALEALVGKEEFRLQQHSAEPPNRYSVVSDLVRIEQLVIAGMAAKGFVVFLTNNPRYWNSPRTLGGDVGAAFRIHQGRRLAGTLAWAAHTAKGTMGKDAVALTLSREYVADWLDYSRTGGQGSSVFRYLAIEVG